MIEIKNKKAYFDYFIEDTYECGIVLTGTEIKSIRRGSCNLKDTYARIKNNELYGLAFEQPDTSLDKYEGNIMVTSEYGWFTQEASNLRIEKWFNLIINYLKVGQQ